MTLAHWLIVWGCMAPIGLLATWMIHKVEEIRKVKPLIPNRWAHVLTQILVILIVLGMAILK